MPRATSGARSGLNCELLQDTAAIGRAHGAWEALALETKNIFATWEWNELWWRHYGSDRPLLVSLCHDGDELVAILPLYLWRARPLRIVRFLGHGPGDELGPLCRPGDEERAGAALRALLADVRADILLAERMPTEHRWGQRLAARPLAIEPSASFDTAGLDWEQYLAQRGSSFRHSLRRNQRRLERNHDVRYRLTATPDELDHDLDVVFALHAARWQGSTTNFLRCESFHRAFAALALERGWLRLWIMEVDGAARAAWYGFRYAGVESFYQGGRDPDPRWRMDGLGIQVLAQSIRGALEDEVDEYRFLRGGEAYKSHFTQSPRALETVAIADNLRARLALTTAVGVRRSVRRVRALRR